MNNSAANTAMIPRRFFRGLDVERFMVFLAKRWADRSSSICLVVGAVCRCGSRTAGPRPGNRPTKNKPRERQGACCFQRPCCTGPRFRQPGGLLAESDRFAPELALGLPFDGIGFARNWRKKPNPIYKFFRSQTGLCQIAGGCGGIEEDGGDCRQETWKNRHVFLGDLLRPLFPTSGCVTSSFPGTTRRGARSSSPR